MLVSRWPGIVVCLPRGCDAALDGIAGGMVKFEAAVNRKAVRAYRNEQKYWTPEDHILGATTEIVVGMVSGWGWKPNLNSYDHYADVGPRLDVRSAKCRTGHLALYVGQKIDRLGVLVIQDNPEIYRVVGAIECVNGMMQRYWRTHDPSGKPLDQPAFWTPQKDLSLELLKRDCRDGRFWHDGSQEEIAAS